MTPKKITVRTNVDFHEFVDFTRDGAALDVSSWQFKIKFLDRAGTELLSVAGALDPALSSRVWFNVLQVNLVDLPTSGVKWYLLALDPDNYISPVRYGDVKVEGGAVWA
jgi:hypothetical protein